MYENVKLLSKEDKNLKVDVVKDFGYSKKLTQCIITVDEFFKASKSQPIVFAKNASDEYFASAILGIEKETNNFVNTKNKWKTSEYIPAYVRRYPFIFVQDKDKLALAYDANCEEVNEKSGQAFIKEDGEQSEYITNVLKFMENYQKQSLVTSRFIKELDDLELLEDANADITIEGKKFAFTGFKRISEEKLSALDEEKTMKLIKNGSYKLIVAHLISMSNFEKLISLQK